MNFTDQDSFKKQIFDTSPLPIVVMDAQSFRYIDCNPAAVKIYGYPSKETVIGKHPVDFSTALQPCGTASSDLTLFHITAAQQKGASIFEWRHQRPNGEIWDAEVHLFSFSIDNRNLLQFSLVDITERKNAERLTAIVHDLILDLNSCNELENAFNRILEAMLTLEGIDSGGIYTTDPADLSLRLVAHRGLSAPFVATVNHFRSDSPNIQLAQTGKPLYGDYAAIRPINDPVRENEGLRSLALIPVLAEGTLIAILNCASHTSDRIPASTRTAIETIAFHIGGSLLRIRVNEALRENEEIFRQFMKNSPVYVFFQDNELRPIKLSDNFHQLSGKPVADTIGKSLHEIFPAPLADKITADDRDILEQGVARVEEEEFNGRYFTTIKFPISIAGKPRYIAGYTIDITDQRKMEQVLHNTQKLESLGILAGGIAHDFNNLLGGIFGYIDLARIETNPELCSMYLSKAIETIDRARALSLQLLTFSKGGEPVKKQVQLTPFIRDTVLFALSGATVSCKFSIDESLWECNCDKHQICQVIDNIVINAVQAMPCGGTIYVDASNATVSDLQKHHHPHDKKMLRISIRDEGIGIPAEYLPRIFDPFYTTKPRGHGLGLSTCFSIVHRHGGTIDVESEPGKGSTFHIFLPAVAPSSSPQETTSSETHHGTGLVLLLDDEKTIQETCSRMLDSFGYTVTVASQGEEAIDIATRFKTTNEAIVAMIFDLTIPGGLGGKEIIAKIRTMFPTIPIFVASGYGETPVMATPGEFGFTASIRKPFSCAELARLLNCHCLPLP